MCRTCYIGLFLNQEESSIFNDREIVFKEVNKIPGVQDSSPASLMKNGVQIQVTRP